MTLYIYKLVSSEEEQSLCNMEARQLLQQSPSWHGQESLVYSTSKVNINRSIFMKWRMVVTLHAQSVDELYELASHLNLLGTYKISGLHRMVGGAIQSMDRTQRQQLEKSIASCITGKVDLKQPDLEYGVIQIDEQFYMGPMMYTENRWLEHQSKPKQYSTALSTRLARTIVNIAIPEPDETLTFVDPCCGIGTVLLEVASLGVKAEGFDLNPVVLQGTRINLAHFQYDVNVTYENMLNINKYYDVAVLDLPYNLCSVLADEDKQAMLRQLSRIARRFVIVSIEPILPMLQQLNITVSDEAVHYKAKFRRELFLCNSENAIL